MHVLDSSNSYMLLSVSKEEAQFISQCLSIVVQQTPMDVTLRTRYNNFIESINYYLDKNKSKKEETE